MIECDAASELLSIRSLLAHARNDASKTEHLVSYAAAASSAYRTTHHWGIAWGGSPWTGRSELAIGRHAFQVGSKQRRENGFYA